jgi:elongation factor G
MMAQVLSLLPASTVQLLEPIMYVEVMLPDQHLGNVLGDLTGHRRASVSNVNFDISGRGRRIQAHVPLKELVGYSTYLRSVSQGTAEFHMSFAHYGELSHNEQQTVYEQFFYRPPSNK